MRNLKKVLTLVLTLAMLLSVMVVGAGAAFTDQESIGNTEAVDACVALNIIGGYEDGSFRPTGNVTRAEMCKMICVALNGGKEPSMGSNLINTFNDVAKDHWAAPYVEYCVSQGIVGGVGGGNFNPNGNITGTQAAKMLLCILGYNASIQGYVGNDFWETKINVDAAQKGLYDELTNIDASAALTRNQAAQMIWNALNAYEVEYITTLVPGPDGTLTSKVTVQDRYDSTLNNKITLLNDKYEANTEDDGYLISVKADNKGTYTVTTTEATYTKVAKDYSDLLGQKVDVLVKKNDRSKVYGVYANEDSAVVASGYVGALELDGSDKVKLDGTSYKLDSGSNSTAITKVANTNDTVTFKSLTDNVAKNSVDKNYAASSIKLIDNNGDSKVDAAVYTPVKVGKVTAVSNTAITVNNGINTVKFDDADIYSGVAKDDYVMFVDEANRSSYDKDAITKLSVSTVKISGTRTGEAKADDSWYKLANNLGDNPTSGSTYDVVIVGGVILFATESSASSKDILYISGTKSFSNFVGENNGTVEARAYFTDKTDKSITVSKLGGDKLTSTNQASVAAGKLYTYSVLSDGTYDVKLLNNTNKAGYDSVTNGTTGGYSDQKIGGKAPSDDAVVFVQTQKETKVLTGAQIKNWGDSAFTTASYIYALTEKNGIDYVGVAALVNAAADVSVPGATKDTLYAYLTADAYVGDRNGDDKATYEVYTSEGAATLYADTTTTASGAVAGAVISYNVNGDYIENIKVGSDITTAFSEVAITGFDYKAKGQLAFVAPAAVNGKITAGINQVTLDEDCVFIGINDEKNSGVENATMDQIQFANPGSHSVSGNETVMTNAYVVVGGDDDKVLAVIFDAENNELDNSKELLKASGSAYVRPAYQIGIANATKDSLNIQLVFCDKSNNNWLNSDEIAALGIKASDITVTVNGAPKALVAGTDDSNKGYIWNNTPICIMNDLPQAFVTELRKNTDVDADYMKVHTGTAFAAGEKIVVSIKDNDNRTFTTSEEYTVPS